MYWTERGLDYTRAEIAKTRERVSEIGKEVDEGGYDRRQTEDSSALWQTFTEHQQKAIKHLEMMENLLKPLAMIAPVPTQIETVCVGHIITFRYWRSGASDPTTLRVVVGGPKESIDNLSPKHYSCSAPLIKKFIGKKVGEETSISIDGRHVDAELLKIEVLEYNPETPDLFSQHAA